MPVPYSKTVTFPDGATNQINVFPAEVGDAPVMVIFPAMGLRASYYSKYASAVSAAGIQVVTIDHRGHGSSSLRPSRTCNFGYKEQVEIEYPAMIEEVRQIFPHSKVVVMGHSLGGQMGSLFVSRYHHLVDGFIMNATCSVYYKGWTGKQRIGVRVGAEMCRLAANVLGYYPGHRMGFGGLEAKGVIMDWYHVAKTGLFLVKGSDFDYEQAMRDFVIPMLAISYAGDDAAPEKALDILVQKFNSSARVERHHLQHPNAPAKKYDHYSWIKDPEITINLVRKWLEKELGI